MKVIVTGACGRIGYRLCEKLKQTFDVIGLDTLAPKTKNPPFDFYQVDFGCDESVDKAFNALINDHGREFVSVIHLAAYYDFEGGAYDQYHNVTVLGTKRLLTNLAPLTVDQLIFSSTLLVYAPCKKTEKITEESPLLPKWEYPRSKIEAEEAIFSRKNSFQAVILRIAGCYDEYCHSIPIAHQMKRIYERSIKSHFYPGDFQSGAPYIHFDDLIDCIEKVIHHSKNLAHTDVLVLGEEDVMTHEELQQKIARALFNTSWKTYPIPKWLAKLGSWIHLHTPFIRPPFIRPWMIDLTDDYYAVDISKSKQLLQWHPRHTLFHMLPTMVQKLQEDPKKWYEENFHVNS